MEGLLLYRLMKFLGSDIYMKKIWIVLIMLFILVLSIILILYFFKNQKKVFYPKAYTGELLNPMIGFAPRGDNESVIWEDYTLVYVDLTWKEWEPNKNEYAYESFETKYNLSKWRNEGKRIVFRFVCDIPGKDKHLDIPEWLYKETNGNGSWYDTSYGKGYSPNYNDSYFIERHEKAIKELGKIYGGDDFFCYIELGSLGHWGEWHIKEDENIIPIPKSDIREQYVKHYLEAFPNTHILMRRPFAIAAKEKLGLFDDMIGNSNSTDEWLGWIESGGEYAQAKESLGALLPMKDAWQTAPIGGELTSVYPMEDILKENLSATIDRLVKSHTSFIGPNVPLPNKINPEYLEGINKMKNTIGFRIRVEKAISKRSILNNKELELELYWKNDGIAPMYYNWDTYIYLIDKAGLIVKKEKQKIDLRMLVKEHNTKTRLDISGLKTGTYQIGIGIVDPLNNLPSISLAMQSQRSDKIYLLAEFEKK